MNSNQDLSTSLLVSPNQLRSLNYFWLGFIIYTLINAFAATNYSSNIKVLQVIQIIAFFLMFTGGIKLMKFRFDNAYLGFIYVLYIIWLFIILVRGFTFQIDYLKTFFFGGWHRGMLYFSPLVLLLPRNLVFYKKVFEVIIILGIFYIIYDVIFVRDLLSSDHSNLKSQGIIEIFSALSIPCGFLLLTHPYHSVKKQLLAVGVIILALLFAIIRARRGLIIIYGNIALLSYILYLFHSRLRLLIIYVTVFIALLGALYTSGVYKPMENRVFGFLMQRGDENSRADVELYFYDDMKTKDWIIGRGVNGVYFCPGVEEDQETNFRDTIETGYEQTILKGGLISLGLFLIIAIPGMVKGLFFSNNLLSKAAGIWIFLSLINSYPSTVNAFTLQYLLVWISIGICYSHEIRSIPDEEMKEIFLSDAASPKILKEAI